MLPREASNDPPGRIAGIDFGTVRIGVALSDPRRKIASPWQNYTRRSTNEDAVFFQRLAAQEGIVLFVVGLPIHLDGREGQKSREARQFGRWLAETTGVSVEFFDERFSSVEAGQLLRDARLTQKRRKGRIDKLAAQIMLSSYLESQEKGARSPGPLDDQ
jgi:putative holliday junction resolvase